MKSEKQGTVNEICRIPDGTIVKGILTSMSDIRIDGCFEGDIYTIGRVVLGEKARVNARILSANADLWGTFNGEMYSSGCVNMKDTANFTGSLKTDKLSVEVGAKFNGTCNIIQKDEFNKVKSEVFPELEVPTASPAISKK